MPAENDPQLLHAVQPPSGMQICVQSRPNHQQTLQQHSSGPSEKFQRSPLTDKVAVSVVEKYGATLEIDFKAEVQARVVTRSGEVLAAAEGEPVGAAWDAIARELFS